MRKSARSFRDVACDPEIGQLDALMEIAAEASAEAGIRQGLEDLAAGRTRAASEVFAEFRVRHSLPR